MNDLHNDGARPRAYTYPVPTARVLDDSERNQLAELRHEGCEAHCDECGRCDWEPTGPTTERTVPMTEIGDDRYLCPDCYSDAENAAAEHRAEAQRDRRDADSETRFNARWPR
jgi:hypothetical protein